MDATQRQRERYIAGMLKARHAIEDFAEVALATDVDEALNDFAWPELEKIRRAVDLFAGDLQPPAWKRDVDAEFAELLGDERTK